jgi:hypothetical protein
MRVRHRDRRVSRERSTIIEHVDPGALERRDIAERVDRLGEQCIGDGFAEIDLVEWIVGLGHQARPVRALAISKW